MEGPLYNKIQHSGSTCILTFVVLEALEALEAPLGRGRDPHPPRSFRDFEALFVFQYHCWWKHMGIGSLL